MHLRTAAATLIAAMGLAVAPLRPASAEPAASPTRLLIHNGEEATISLRSNPTTGYQWSVKAMKPQHGFTIDKGAYVRPTSAAPGASGWTVYHVKQGETGLTTLVFTYARAFEKGKPPARTFTVVVRSEPSTSAARSTSQVFYCQPGDEFSIPLASPDAAWTWKLMERSYDGGVLQSLGRTVVPAPAPKPKQKPQPATTIQRFRAVGVGDTKAILTYEKEGVEHAAVNTTAVRVEK